MSRAEQLDLGILIAEQVRDRRGQHLDRTCRGLANEEVSGLGIQERVLDQLHGLLKGHQESRHLGLCQGQGLPGLELLYEQGDD